MKTKNNDITFLRGLKRHFSASSIEQHVTNLSVFDAVRHFSCSFWHFKAKFIL